MAKEIKTIDVSNMPELLKLAEEVGKSNEPLVLRRDDEDVAVLMPMRKRPTSPSRAKPLTKDDSLFGLIGIGKSGIPGGVSGRKHEYLVEAHRKHR